MKTIMVIDDEDDFCFMLKKNIEVRGDYNVLVCTEGEKAIREMKVNQPDIVLVDILMPNVSGAEIVEKMREDEVLKDIPYVFLTAVVGQNEVKDHGDIIGGNVFLAKPVKIESILDVVNDALAVKQKKRSID